MASVAMARCCSGMLFMVPYAWKPLCHLDHGTSVWAMKLIVGCQYQDQCGVYWVMRPADVEITMDNMDNPRYQHVYAHGVKFDSASRLS